MWSPFYFRNVPVTRHADSQTESAEYESTAGTTFQHSSKREMQREMLSDKRLQDSLAKFCIDPICDGSDNSHIPAESRNDRKHQNSFSKLGSPEDPNILTNFNAGIEISKITQGIKMSITVSESSINKFLSALQKAISPTLEQNKESSECNHEVGHLDAERNRVELDKNSEEIKKSIERECCSNPTSNDFDYLEKNLKVSIQSEDMSNDSVNLHSPSVAIEDNSSAVNSRDTEGDLQAKRKSVASSISSSGSTLDSPAEMHSTQFENLVESFCTGSESLCVNDENMTKKDILSASNEDQDVDSNEVKHSKLCHNREYGNEDVSEHTLHALVKKTVSARTYCNSDRKFMSKKVSSETPNKDFDEKETPMSPKEQNADSYLRTDQAVESSTEISSGLNDVKASKSEVSEETKTAFDVSSTVNQKEGDNENKNIENNSKPMKTLEPTGSQMEIVCLEVAELAPNLNSDYVRNMTDEGEDLSTLIKKNAHEQKVEVYPLPLSKIIAETSEKNIFEHKSLQKICSDQMKSGSFLKVSDHAISSEVQEKEILAKKINLTQITDLETRRTKESGKSDTFKEILIENSPIKSNLPSELHVPDENTNQKIEKSIENPECCHQNNSGKDLTPCTTDEITFEENASGYIDTENVSEGSKMNNSDAEPEVKCLESEPSCDIERENNEELGTEQNILGTPNHEIQTGNFNSLSIASSKNNENKRESLSSSISEKTCLSEITEHDNSLLKTSGEGVSTDKQCNRNDSIIDTSRKEYLQNMLESETLSVEPELNLKKSNMPLDSELVSEKLLGGITLVENNAITLAETASSQSEEEFVETNQTTGTSVVGSKKMKSNAQNDLISDKDVLVQSNMTINIGACKHMDSDTKHEKNCTRSVMDSIVSDADLSCGFAFLDSNEESKEIKKEAPGNLNADNTINFAQNVEADNGLRSESNEESQETLNTNELVLASDEESIIEEEFELGSTPLKVRTESTLGSDEESILKENEIPSTEVADIPLKVLNEDIPASEEITLEQKVIQSAENADTPLKVSSEYVSASKKEHRIVSEKQCSEHDTPLKVLDKNPHASAENSTVEQKENQSVQVTDSPLKILCESTLGSDEESIAKENPSTEVADIPLKVLSEDILASEEEVTLQQKVTHSTEVADTPLKVSSEYISASRKEHTVVPEKQSIEHEDTPLQVMSKNPFASAEEASVEQKANQSVQVSSCSSPLKVLYENTLASDEESIAEQKEIPKVENVHADHLVLQKVVSAVKLDTSTSNKLVIKELLEEPKNEESAFNQDFGLSQANLSLKNNVQFIQNKCLVPDANDSSHTGNAEIKYQRSEPKNGNIQKSSTKTTSEARVMNNSLEHSLRSEENTPEDNLTYVKADGTVSERSLNKNLQSNSGKEEKFEISKNSDILGNNSKLITSKKPILDKKCCIAENENVLQIFTKYGDIVKNAVTINANEKYSKTRSLNSSSTETPENNSTVAVDSQLPDDKEASFSLVEDTEKVSVSENVPSQLNEMQVEHSSNDGLSLDTHSFDKITDVTLPNDSKKMLPISKKSASKEALNEDQGPDTSFNVDNSNQVKTSNKEITASKENSLDTTYVVPSSEECKKQLFKLRDPRKGECENASNDDSERESSVSTCDEIDAAPTRHRTFPDTAIITDMIVEENEDAENIVATSSDKMLSKTTHSVRNLGENLPSKRSDRCKSEEPIASSSRTSAKSIQGRRSSESLVRRISTEFQSKIEAGPKRQSPRIAKIKNGSLDSGLNTQKTLQKTRSFQENTVRTKITRSNPKGAVDSSESDQSELNAETVSTPVNLRVRTRNTAVTETTSSSNPLKKVSEERTTLRERGRNTKIIQDDSVVAKVPRAKAKGTVDSSESDQSEFNAELVSTPTKQKARTRNTALSVKIKASNSLEKVSEESTTPRKRSRENATAVKQHSKDESSSSFNATKRNRTRNTDLEAEKPAVSTRKTRTGK